MDILDKVCEQIERDVDLWDKVCEQIERDVNDPLNDMTALYLLLQRVPKDVLIAYLPEDED